ncbi:MAG: hypothetical protein LBD48_06280 [Treponema sp.]|nr:hypothetical protein [Treponema sp.]
MLWEILEFAADVITGSAHQKWNLSGSKPMLEKSFQGSGLRDTMSDLIVDSAGALITSVVTNYIYKYRKKERWKRWEK